MREKITSIFQKTKQSLAVSLLSIDSKISTLIPNPKVKKIAYIGVGSLFGFMFLIILLGLLLSPLRKTGDNGLLLNKPKIIVDSPRPEVNLTEKQKEILKLQTEINEMKFPESVLNIPIIESNLSF
ncbi:MAG: hypothetical protein AAB778_02040 [Patescibacteria group bacterium]